MFLRCYKKIYVTQRAIIWMRIICRRGTALHCDKINTVLGEQLDNTHVRLTDPNLMSNFLQRKCVPFLAYFCRNGFPVNTAICKSAYCLLAALLDKRVPVDFLWKRI